MRSTLLKTYHKLPVGLRSLAATFHGYRLNSRRYGPDSERAVRQALARDTWSAESWERWRKQRLSYVLTRAATKVPYYRDYWAKRGQQRDGTAIKNLAEWPILEKETVRRNPEAFIADDCDKREMCHLQTSGTTGKPVELWLSRRTLQRWYSLFEARWRRWYGVQRHDRWAILGGQLVAPVAQRKPPFWVWNAASRQLYMSVYHLAPRFMPAYLEALERFRVKYLFGYTSALCSLAGSASREGLRKLGIQVVITNAEPLHADQRQTIQEVFDCPVRETYSMVEMVVAASECSAGRLHLWPEAGILEVQSNGCSVPAGTVGELVCTGLMNADMPLIRYRTGDRGALPKGDAECGCGIRLPMLLTVDGRQDDLLYGSDGRAIGRLDPVFKSNIPIREAQIIQEALHRVRVRYVPDSGHDSDTGRLIARRIQERMGSVDVILDPVDHIPRGPNGKFRAVICQLPKENLPSHEYSQGLP